MSALTPSSVVGRWPGRPRSAPRALGCTAPAVEHTFPSARAAILACLRLAGIDPRGSVATPECVTGCINTAVRRLARPIPLRVAVDGARQTGAAIVYEQWGWPLPPSAVGAVNERLPGVPLILDRVDSADFFYAARTYAAFEVLSLSKVLGLDAGGIARQRQDGAYLRFTARASSERAPGAGRPGLVSHPAVRELFKQSQFVHPTVIGWLAGNCMHAALEAERQARCAAAGVILESDLSAGWPAWMTEAIESGAGPVWAPVLRGKNPEVHARAAASLEREVGVRAAVRMFNWTGDPISPCYEPTLALPIHGGVEHPAEAAAALRAIPGVR
ncbi:MAG: hypothetical protein ACR2IK_20140 [Chloroflexota bacterium]